MVGEVIAATFLSCAPEFKETFKMYGKNGWTAAARNPEYGGQGFPHMMRIVINDMMYGAAQSFNMAPSLTHGAAHLIEKFADRELKERFIPKMYNGEWAGTMTLASTAYQNALAYTKERIQGSDVAGRRSGYVPIIDHPDIRRMLLWMKACVDGMRSMIYAGAFWSDLSLELPDGDEKQHYLSLVDFMTPIIKAYCSDIGFKVCETAIQCLGGYGYCKEYHLEQYLRDLKILSLYEGTNGIQSMDLLGRKMRMNKSAPFKAFLVEVESFCEKNTDHPVLGRQVRTLSDGVKRLTNVAIEMAERSKSDPLQWSSYSYSALLCFGDITIAWRLLDMALIAKNRMDEGKENDFLIGKLMQATYFIETILPVTLGRMDTCIRDGREIVNMPEGAF